MNLRRLPVELPDAHPIPGGLAMTTSERMPPSSTREQDPRSATAAIEEATLVAQLAEGQAGAINELYDRYARPLYGLGMRLLGDQGLAEEMVQDTFVRLWRSAPRFDPGQASVKTYIYTLARRAAIDLQRRPASRPVAGADLEEVDQGATGPSDPTADQFDQLVSGLEIRAALETLKANHRQVLELYYLEDLPQAQIAERLGIPVGTVKTRTYYALRQLKLELEERSALV